MDVYLYTADGGNVMKWTDVASYDEQPAWSPDGQWIAFSARSGTQTATVGLDDASDLWVVPVAGGEPRVLLQGPQQDWAPDWTR